MESSFPTIYNFVIFFHNKYELTTSYTSFYAQIPALISIRVATFAIRVSQSHFASDNFLMSPHKSSINNKLNVFLSPIHKTFFVFSFNLCRVFFSLLLQGLAKRVFQSHIVSLRNAQEKTDRSQKRSSSSHSNQTDNHSRRIDHRSRNREDLRETLRKERQRERERSRNREKERRRSGEKAHNTHASDSGLGRTFSSHRDENSPDPSLLSVVRVTPRPQMPAALQANRSLILKAVAEAQKSVSKLVVRPEPADVKTRIKPVQLKRSFIDKARIHKQLMAETLSPVKVL